jgi:phage tail P2-like protein
MTRAPASLVPPSIADARGRAFGVTMQRALDEPDFSALLIEQVETVDARLLPFLVRQLSMEEFVEPDMREDIVRALLTRAYELHARKGFLDGVRLGFDLLGVRVDWRQWFEMTPPGAPGTHRARLYLRRRLFKGAGPLIDERVQRAVVRMIDHMKRWSQDVDFALAIEARSDLGAKTAGLALQAMVAQAVAVPPKPSMLRRPCGVAAAGRALEVAAPLACASPPAPQRPQGRIGQSVAAQSLATLSSALAARACAPRPRASCGAGAYAAPLAAARLTMEASVRPRLSHRIGAFVALAAPLAFAHLRMEVQP